MEYEKLMLICDELKEYAELDGTELGEVCDSLIQLTHFGDYISEEFMESLETEIISQLENFKLNTTISKRVVTTQCVVKELEWS